MEAEFDWLLQKKKKKASLGIDLMTYSMKSFGAILYSHPVKSPSKTFLKKKQKVIGKLSVNHAQADQRFSKGLAQS